MASAPSEEHSIDTKSSFSAGWAMLILLVSQIAFVSLAAFRSELLIYDEVRWYKIDYFDALVWGLIITQVFAGALYVAEKRVRSFKEAITVFCIIGLLAFGLTIAAIGVFLEEATGWSEIFSFLSIGGGYWLAVFVFLVSMFLQLRLVIWCLQAIERLWTTSKPNPSLDDDSQRHFSIVDAFSFTGLAAVSIASLRMTLRLMLENDTIRLLAMFYAGSLIAFIGYGLCRLKGSLPAKIGVGLGTVFILSAVELLLANSYSTRRLPITIQFAPLVFWNLELLVVASLQILLLQRFARQKEAESKQ